MLTNKLPHLLVTLFVGLLIGCGSSNPLVDKAQSNVESQNYEAALKSAEQAIKKHPKNPRGYYYKAVALSEIAGNTDSQKAQKLYKQMNEAFAKAQEVAANQEGDMPGEIQRITAVKDVLWQTEHNQGVKYATDDSLKGTVKDPLATSIGHLKSATIIRPDSSLSWNVLAQVSGMNKSFKQAANAKTKYIETAADTTVTPKDYRQLASYYYRLENQQKVLEVFQKAQEQYPKNKKIVSNLADAYNRVGQSEKAISTVENLVDQNPENAQYRLALGTQIYQKALKLNDSLSANSNEILQLQQKLKKADESKTEQIKQKISKIEQESQQIRPTYEKLTKRAEKHLKKVVELDSENASAYNTLGIIYQNRAKALFDKRNRTDDLEKVKKLDKQGKDQLRVAMKYYERATEINPNTKKYWRSLFSIYTALGMDKKAKKAMKKAGMKNN